MKRFCTLPLVFVLVLSLVACGKSDKELQVPVKFYYLNDEIGYGVDDGVISFEEREAAQIQNDLYALVQSYLLGPENAQLSRAVPASVCVEAVQSDQDTIILTLSPEFARLSGIDLTLACSCLSMTLLDYTNAQTVQIQVTDSLLAEGESITMTREDILLVDGALIPNETE